MEYQGGMQKKSQARRSSDIYTSFNTQMGTDHDIHTLLGLSMIWIDLPVEFHGLQAIFLVIPANFSGKDQSTRSREHDKLLLRGIRQRRWSGCCHT